ncbi:MAG: response regulator [Proteobacteria bacterium]|nr:response regulator [Pseudomonadota bacterium]
MDRTKVLIVDDDERIANLAKIILDNMFEKGAVYNIKTAINGEEGYMVSLDFKPDIILTDIQMPGKNGIEMVRAIRQHSPEVKTIYMSGEWTKFQTPLQEEHTMHQACFLKKPFVISELTQLLCES